MTSSDLVRREVRFANRSFWRNPVAAFFTVVFPLAGLVAFARFFGGTVTLASVGTIGRGDYYVAAMAVFGVVAAALTNVAIAVAFARDKGTLRRLRATPAPTWLYLCGRSAHAIVLALVLVAAELSLGAAAYRTRVVWWRLPAVLVVVLVAAVTFAALGLSLAALVPNAEASPAVVNAVVFPMLLVSDVFAPGRSAHGLLSTLAGTLPVRPFLDALLYALYGKQGSGLLLRPIVLLALWGVSGAVLATRYLSWEPRR